MQSARDFALERLDKLIISLIFEFASEGVSRRIVVSVWPGMSSTKGDRIVRKAIKVQ